MASIRPYRTAKGDRRYEVRYRSSEGGERSRYLLGAQGRAGVQARRRAKTPQPGRSTSPLRCGSVKPLSSGLSASMWSGRPSSAPAEDAGQHSRVFAPARAALAPLDRSCPTTASRGPRCATSRCHAKASGNEPGAVEAHPPERRGARTTGGSRGLPRQDRSARRAGAGSSQLERRRRAPIVDARIRCSDRAGRRPQPLQAGRASGSSRPRRQLRRRRDLRHRPRRSFWANAYEDSRRAADGRHRAARATAAARTAARANPERSRSSLPDTSRRSIRATQLHGTRVQAGGASGRLSGVSRSTTSDIPAPH